MGTNFSAIGLGEIPNAIGSHIASICDNFASLNAKSGQLASIVGGQLAGSWQDVGSKYMTFSNRINEVGQQLIDQINRYVEATLANENAATTDVSDINERLTAINSSLDTLNF